MVRQRMSPRERPKRESDGPRHRRLPYLLAWLSCCVAYDCDAIDRVTLEVGQLSTAGVQAKSATIIVDVSTQPKVRVQAGQLHLVEPNNTYSDVDINCIDLLIKDPLFACYHGSVTARGGPTGQISMNAAGSYDTSNGAVSISGSELKIAGATTRFSGKLQWGTWTLNAEGAGLDLVEAGKLAQPWFRLPQGDTLTGHLNFDLAASGQLGGRIRAQLQANTADLNFSNQAGTTVAQNLTAAFTGSAVQDEGKLTSDIKLESSGGQALAGAVLLDFGKIPLSLMAHVEPDGARVNLQRIQLHGTDLIDAQGFAQVSSSGIEQAHFDIQRLEFAAAYRSFLQLTLATTDFGALNVGGRAIGDIDIANNDLTSVNAHITNVSMADATARLSLANANGEIHWSSVPTRAQVPAAASAPTSTVGTPMGYAASTAQPKTSASNGKSGPTVPSDAAPPTSTAVAQTSATDAGAPPRGAASASLASVPNATPTVVSSSSPQQSQLSWSASSLYGLIGGPVQMKFIAQGARFALTDTTRFPIFDGALVAHKLDIRNFGPDSELDFDAHLEPISMPLLSKAFGWPTLNGQLAGRVPGVSYRNHVLTVQGDLSANVFDGTIVGSRLKLSDPLGPWPRLDADVSARHLDLDLLTHTFSIGSISGRLDADIKGLELFNWSPVAFDARLQTTPGDKSEHRISQRAVTSISSVGGGGGGVTAALQSGVLQFFKTFHYDRIGISCQLRDEVCLMNGLEPAKSGYYLVKGRGLPRIDIIGNAGRVDWTQLVSQISASMHSQNITVR